MPVTNTKPTTTPNAIFLGENLLCFDRDFRAASRSIAQSWHALASRSTGTLSPRGWRLGQLAQLFLLLVGPDQTGRDDELRRVLDGEIEQDHLAGLHEDDEAGGGVRAV